MIYHGKEVTVLDYGKETSVIKCEDGILCVHTNELEEAKAEPKKRAKKDA